MADNIRLENVTFAFHPDARDPVLTDINLNIEQGESVALIGTNGSGKTTIVRLLNALLLPTRGKVIAAGLDTADPRNHPLIRQRVGLVFQRPQDQIVASTVEEEIAFGPSNLGLPPREIRARVEQVLTLTRLQALRDRHPFLLSAGEAQRLALAGVLAMRPRCVIFDESTAMLDPLNSKTVMQQAEKLHQQGITTIMITHRMQEAAQCSRVLVLHHGRLLGDGAPSAVFSRASELESIGLAQPIVHAAARELRKFFPSLPANINRTDQLLSALPTHPGNTLVPQSSSPQVACENLTKPLIHVDRLTHTYPAQSAAYPPALDQISLRVMKGHMHALIGASGSGKSTLLQHLNALIRPQSGQVTVGPFNLNRQDLDTIALRRMVALAFQQPEDQIFAYYVGDEIAYGPRNLGFDGKLADIVARAMQEVGLDFDRYKDRLTSELSGGERRKVALASVLAMRADIILLDEPLAGLDPKSRRQLLGLLRDLQQKGKTLLISTHQYEGLLDMLNTVSVLQHGRDVLHGPPQHVFSQFSALHSAGILPPFHVRLAQALRDRGWPIPSAVMGLPALAAAIERGSGAAI